MTNVKTHWMRTSARVLLSVLLVVVLGALLYEQYLDWSGAPGHDTKSWWKLAGLTAVDLVLVYLLVDTWRTHRSTLEKLKDWRLEPPSPVKISLARGHAGEVIRKNGLQVPRTMLRVLVSGMFISLMIGTAYLFWDVTTTGDMDAIVLVGVVVSGVELLMLLMVTSIWRR